jgi:LacI family transcriptional regulator
LAGYGLFLCNTDQRADKQRAYIDMLLEHQVSGILLAPVEGTAAEVAALRESDVPLVTLGYNAAELALDSVRLDYASGAQAAIEHLLAFGHRRIALLLAQPGRTLAVARQRLRGCALAFQAAGITPDPALELPVEDTVDDAYAGMMRLLETSVECTAVVGFALDTTLGALLALRQHQLHIPSDMSVWDSGTPRGCGPMTRQSRCWIIRTWRSVRKPRPCSCGESRS